MPVAWAAEALIAAVPNSSAIPSSSAAAASAVGRSLVHLRDLGLRGEQPGSRELAPRDLLEAPSDRGRRGVRTPSCHEEERRAGLRLGAERPGLSEGLLRALEVAHPQPDLAQLVERAAGRCRMETLQLRRGRLRFRGRVRPGAGEAQELGPVDAADARETGDVLALTPPLRHVGPFAAAPVVRGLSADRHHSAEHRAGRERAQLAADRDASRLLHQTERLVELARPFPAPRRG